MTHVLDGTGLTCRALVRIARGGEKVELSPQALARIVECRALLERKIEQKEVMYGVNTGIGELVNVVLDEDQTRDFQKYLIYNHAAGIGDPAPIEHVRGAMAARVNVHAHGHSGCRPEITQTLVAMLNKGVTPYVCAKGSVGACGDLAPMAQIALLMMGEGQAYYGDELLPGAEALAKADIPVPGLQARDGLSCINGSNLLTAISALHVVDMDRWLRQAEIACAMSLEALLANLVPYDKRLHQVRGFAGAVRSAAAIGRCVAGGDLASGKIDVKVQDAYSMRSSPQVIGAAHDALRWARSQVETELNGVGDNPIFFPEDGTALTGANFQGSPVSLPMEGAGVAITMVSVLSERRLNRLLHPALSVGLPAFLTRGAGMFSGLMLSQYTADALITEQRLLSAPAATLSIPAAADQEDFVSMGMNTVLKNGQILENAHGVLGIELMAAAQALDLREMTPGEGSRSAREVIRRYVDFLDVDRPLHSDHTAMQQLVRSGEILDAVEATIGPLAPSDEGPISPHPRH